MIRLDMSEYMEKHSISRLIGSPPGYVGYDDGGQLTEKVRRKPYSVVLFDEIEKAHPEIMNLLLQLLEDGQLTDSQGRKVSFRNTVVIMTSNLGSRQKKRNGIGFANNEADAENEKIARRYIEGLFRPEFLDRVDEIIYFPPLANDSLIKICNGMLKEVIHRAAMRGIELTFSPDAIKHICASTQNKGARELRRQIAILVENPLAAMLVEMGNDAPNKISLRLDNTEKKLNFYTNAEN